ncbi:MAG: sigma-70 family RNA polymerase sigma factor [Bacilli bacterium]|jgi:RNA polymerase sigma-70 factor (ECF subfamily)|nr:sigma-70 family RNA polymerase sigma factor [Bacilli bacterium]MCH4228851.1 sigma-70 family RNA polymerase sigma factor [Bacilli bacterium]MCH4277983.1 sigma-70 family RNA polymerase sigma factor [Bacilli bacterium]MCI2054753.1 sigma-70 family RNA polymerase sigma factor [Bacilli bacterium]
MRTDQIQKIYEAYSQDVMNVAFFYSSSKEDAEDAIIDVFTELIEKEPKNLDNIKSYLLKSAMRKAIDIDRKNARAAHDNLFDEGISSDSEEGQRKLDVSIVRELPSRLKGPLVLFYVNDMSIKEISDSLSISESAVKMRLKRAKELLRRRLQNEKP